MINSKKITKDAYCITFSDNFENVVFGGHLPFKMGEFIEILGKYSMKKYNSIVFHKIFVNRISNSSYNNK